MTKKEFNRQTRETVYLELFEFLSFDIVSCIQRLSATLGFKGFGRCFKI